MAKTKPENKASFKSLAELQLSLNKQFGAGTLMLGQDQIVSVDTFSSQIATIDIAFGHGIPVGRIIEIHGLESSGKTTTCLQFIAACQQHFFPKKNRKGVAAIIDVEHALDRNWAQKVGVNLNELIFSQPNCGEEAIQIAETMVESGLVDLIVIDSVAALIPRAVLEGTIEDVHIGALARLMSKSLNRLQPKCNTHQTTIIFINQIREKIGVMFGNPQTTPGGLALKFYATIRAIISKGSPIVMNKSTTVGFSPTMKVIKNKVAAPFMTASYNIYVGHPLAPVYGLCKHSALLDAADALGILTKKGSHIYYGDIILGNGFENAIEFVRSTPTIFEKLMNETIAKAGINKTIITEENTDSDDDPILDGSPDGDPPV